MFRVSKHVETLRWATIQLLANDERLAVVEPRAAGLLVILDVPHLRGYLACLCNQTGAVSACGVLAT